LALLQILKRSRPLVECWTVSKLFSILLVEIKVERAEC
jgi:hypothetical protein